MITIDIYWNDLTTKKQKEIQEALNMKPDDNGNWDVFPIATLDVEESEMSDSHDDVSIGIEEVVKHVGIAERSAWGTIWGTEEGKPVYKFKTDGHILEIRGKVIEPSYEFFRPAFSFKEDNTLLYDEDSVNVGPYRNESVMNGVYKDSTKLFEYLKSKYADSRFTEIV